MIPRCVVFTSMGKTLLYPVQDLFAFEEQRRSQCNLFQIVNHHNYYEKSQHLQACETSENVAWT